MLRCAAGGACTFVANLPVVSWQFAWHGTAEKRCTGQQLEMGALKKCCTQISRLSSLVVKPELNLYLQYALDYIRISSGRK